jgi:hypothetical protein
MRRIGVLTSFAASDPEVNAWLRAFQEKLHTLDGRKVAIFKSNIVWLAPPINSVCEPTQPSWWAWRPTCSLLPPPRRC